MEHIGVIGGGIVGMAIARSLSQREMAYVTVLEKESRVAAHQTGHNSGVVHAGIYYPPESLKAKLCGLGREMTKEFCAEKRLPFRESGKLVVALDASEIAALDDIEHRARRNNVPGIRRVGAEELREIEPHAAGIAGVHSPHTAVADFAAITEAMAEDVRRSSGSIMLKQEVVAIYAASSDVRVRTTNDAYRFDRLIVCAGLQSDVIAQMLGADAAPKILPFRGEYWHLGAAHLVNSMIYPVPDPRYPFLGVHFTRGVYDEVLVGPNAVPALAREGYRWSRVNLRDIAASLRWPGALPLAREHWRMGVREAAASLFKQRYVAQAQAYIPALQAHDLTHRTAAGVRAQAWARDGSLLDDFAVDQLGPVTLLRNAPSPAATSALAIADYVLERYLGISQ